MTKEILIIDDNIDIRNLISSILIDKGFSIEQISIVAGIYIFISLISLFFIRKRLNPVII